MMMAFIRSLTPLGKGIMALALLIVVVLAFMFVRNLMTGTARTEARLGTEQADAAVESGRDATQSVGGQSETEAERERSVGELRKDVDDAKDADDAHAAGAGWLCNNFGICPEK
jgi:hypothetical protein